MRWSAESRLVIGLIVAFGLILAGSTASYLSSMTNIRTSGAVEQSIQFTGSMESLYGLSKDLDASAHSFVTTGSNRSLAQYTDAHNSITRIITEMKEVYQGDRRRLTYIVVLEQLINSLVRESEMGVRSKSDDRAMAVQAYLKNNRFAEMWRHIRSKIDLIEDDERILLHSQIVDYDASTRTSINTYLALSFLVLLFLLLLGGTTYRYILVIRKAMEADRRVSREIVEHAPIGILKLASNLSVTEVNPVFCRYTSKRPEEIINKKVTEVLPELPKTAFLEAVEKGTAHQIDQLFIKLDKDDIENERYWDVTLWPVQEAGAIKGMILLVVDVTEKVNLSNQREVFAQTLTHDMKTPLIAADRIYEAILDARVGNIDRAQYDLMEKLRKNNQDVLKMVKDVLEVSRYKQHNLILSQENIDIKPMVQDVLAKLSATSDHRAITLKSEIPDGMPGAWADRTAVHHLIFNLIENAIKFSPLEGIVTITAESVDSWLTLHVQDSGPGMSDEDQKKLFKSSWQGELGKTAPSGTGLGLYLCHQIAKANRGEITCKSELGTGTTFSVALPLAPKAVPVTEDDDDDDEMNVEQENVDNKNSDGTVAMAAKAEQVKKIATGEVEPEAEPEKDSAPHAVPS